MRRLVFASLFVLIVSIGPFTPQAGASESHLVAVSKPLIVYMSATGAMATIDLVSWLKYLLGRYFGSVWNHEPNGSVPIPGTLLLFGGGFAGLVFWRARQLKD